jgi:hypothetical protein
LQTGHLRDALFAFSDYFHIPDGRHGAWTERGEGGRIYHTASTTAAMMSVSFPLPLN